MPLAGVVLDGVAGGDAGFFFFFAAVVDLDGVAGPSTTTVFVGVTGLAASAAAA